MVICRNCRSSLSNGTRFCSICGYKISELPIAPLFHENISSNAPAIWREDEMEQLVDSLSEWDDASPTDPSLLPVHGDHHQPVSTHREHQKTQPLDFLPTHGTHQKTQPMDPLQPLPTHSTHQKNQPMHLIHPQPQEIHAAHRLPVAGHPRQLKEGQSGRRSSYQIIAILLLLVVSLVAITFLFVSSKRNSSDSATTSIIANATLVTSGKAIPGQTLQVVGNHFPPSQTVLVTLDDRPLVKNEAIADTWHSSAMRLVSLSSANVRGTPIAIHADGTFTIVIHIAPDWKVGSTHHLSIYNQQGKELKSLNLPIKADQLTRQQIIHETAGKHTHLITVPPNMLIHRPG